ncbi:MAG: glycosyltransferase [Acidimicrobiales bacterium]
MSEGERPSIRHLDLSCTGLPAIEGPASLFLWWRALPLGDVSLAGTPSPGWLASEIARVIAPAVAERLQPGSIGNDLAGEDGRPVDASVRALAALRLERLDDLDVATGADVDASAVSVVVCTRRRPEPLRRVLRALDRQDATPGEIVVVDNDPARGDVLRVLEEFPHVRYVPERREGLSIARNTGIRRATGTVIAFTDDDAEPHPAWTAQVARALARPGAPLALTGLVLPAELDSEGAALFEELYSFGQGYLPRIYDSTWFNGHRRRGTPVWNLGAGANMAFRREAFALVGGYDERLGAGASGCSEDSELWYRLLASGAPIAYEPAAVVFHHHRTDLDELRDQLASYLEGHVSALFVQFSRSRHPGNLIRAGYRLPLHHWRRWRHRRDDPLVRAEIRGYTTGLRRHWRMAVRPEPAPNVSRSAMLAPAGQFFRANPYPHPLTEGFFYREKMRAIHRVAPPGPVQRVLEIGGGQSGLTSLLYPGAVVVTVDIDPAYGHAPGTRGSAFVAADAARLPFPDRSFDVVTLFDLLEHVHDDTSAAAEARRVVRPGGSVILSSPTERWRYPYHRALTAICPTAEELMEDWGHVRVGYDLARLDTLFGGRRERSATFISPVTALAHDLSFSRLPGRIRRAAIVLVSPLTWAGYALHRPSHPGSEVAAVWPRH